MANSADPDQLASEKPTDLELQCLQEQGISGFSRTSLTVYILKVIVTLPVKVLLVNILTTFAVEGHSIPIFPMKISSSFDRGCSKVFVAFNCLVTF